MTGADGMHLLSFPSSKDTTFTVDLHVGSAGAQISGLDAPIVVINFAFAVRRSTVNATRNVTLRKLGGHEKLREGMMAIRALAGSAIVKMMTKGTSIVVVAVFSSQVFSTVALLALLSSS